MNKKEVISQSVLPLLGAFGSFLFIIIIGSVGYMLIDDRFSFMESLYMTVITISTVGFKEVYSLTDAGKLFTIFLILSNIMVFGYFVSVVTAYVIDGVFHKNLKKYRVNKRIEKLKDHVIVCGYGRNGRQAATDLKVHQQKYVVIDKNEERIELLKENPDEMYIHGDATNEPVLQAAQITEAKALITAMPSDAVNVYIVLTARELNPNIRIISRCSDTHAKGKLRRAGADNIIMPDLIGGQKMARLVAQPDIVEFLEQILLQSASDVNIEEIFCEELASNIEGHSLKELDIKANFDINIIGIRNEDGSYLYNPSGNTILKKGKQLFVMGHKHDIKELRKLLTQG